MGVRVRRSEFRGKSQKGCEHRKDMPSWGEVGAAPGRRHTQMMVEIADFQPLGLTILFPLSSQGHRAQC